MSPRICGQSHEHKSLLRFITCGSVDDGKSTLIGRLLYESKLIFEDQLAALEADSKKVGTQGGDLDFALLVDGLAAEREQGITIDVAYRFFHTENRKFIVADTPGHEQYTRNMVTGASTADLAVILIDARKGVLTQTRRHSYLVVADGHPPHRAGDQQDGSASTIPRTSSPRSTRNTAISPARSACTTSRRSRSRRCGATTCWRAATRHPGTRAGPHGASGNGRTRQQPAEPALPPARPMGEPARISISAASPAPSRAAPFIRATGSACCLPAPKARSNGSSPMTAIWTKPSPANR